MGCTIKKKKKKKKIYDNSRIKIFLWIVKKKKSLSFYLSLVIFGPILHYVLLILETSQPSSASICNLVD